MKDTVTQQLEKTYDLIADDWDRTQADTTWWHEGKDKFISFLPTGSHVLDVGCGSGKQAQQFIEAGYEVFGIDVSSRMIEICRRNIPAGAFGVLDMRDIDVLQEKFDGVYMQASLLHIPKKEVSKTFSNIISVLNQGGYLYVSVKQRRPDGPEEEIKMDNDFGYPFERFFSYFTVEEVRDLFRKENLAVVWSKVENSGHSKWIQVIGQKA